MKYSDYKKLSRQEKKSFKKLGGKIEHSLFSRVMGGITVGIIIFLMIRCAVKPSTEKEPMPWDAAETACLNASRSQADSLLDMSVRSNHDWGKDGYKIIIRIEKKNALADLGIVCYAKRDGSIVKTEGIVLNKAKN